MPEPLALLRIAYGDLAGSYSSLRDDEAFEATLVRTQGAALTVADLLSTLVEEAAVHHLDLGVRLDRPGPSAGPLAEVRRVLEGPCGDPLPSTWDDATAVLLGTGRQVLHDHHRAALGAGAERFPPFG